MKSQRASYSVVSDETWELVRGAYLSGLSASVVAARFGITVWGLRKRAGREGWTKIAHHRARTGEGVAPLPFGEPASESELDADMVLRRALDRAGRALMKGEGMEAQALVRAAEGYDRLAKTLRRRHVETEEDDGEDVLEVLRRRLAELRAEKVEPDGRDPASEDPS